MDKKRSRLDLLSDLPLSIIHHILTFVPIRDAIKTSILSRQWRYIWATLPQLVFNEECVSFGEDLDVPIFEIKLKEFINQALLLHKGPIHKFKLHVISMESRFIDPWLIFLSRNSNIRMLILSAQELEGWTQMHSSLYSCQKLTHLELFNCAIPPPPTTFHGFLCLKILVLEALEASCETIAHIAAKSPFLEEFTLNKSDESSLELRIHAPNLKYFHVEGAYKEILLYAPLLCKLSSRFTVKRLQSNGAICKSINFLGRFPALEDLCGDIFFIKHFSIDAKPCDESLVFHHLRVLELGSVSFKHKKETWEVVRLIMGAPNLYKLNIEISSRDCSKCVSSWDSEGAPEFTFERMKVIEMRYALGGVHEMKFIKSLLENSPVLETMIYHPDAFVKDDKLVTLMADLMRCRRASKNAEILFRKR